MEIRKNVNEISGILKEFQRYLQDEERGAATVEKYIRDVRALVEYIDRMGDIKNTEESVEIRKLDKETVREYKQALKERYKITSANSMLAALNSFFTFLGREELRCV